MDANRNFLRIALPLVAALLTVGAGPVYADIYKFVDKYGRVTLTDRPSHGGFQLLVKTWKGWGLRAPTLRYPSASLSKSRKYYAPEITRAAMLYRLPDALLHAVITAESAYNASAVSPAGAVGMMQLMPETARRYGVGDRHDPVANIHGGSRYLRDLLHMFNNNLVLALAAYNAGEGAVMQYGNKVPPYRETQTYVRKVLDIYQKYRTTM